MFSLHVKVSLPFCGRYIYAISIQFIYSTVHYWEEPFPPHYCVVCTQRYTLSLCAGLQQMGTHSSFVSCNSLFSSPQERKPDYLWVNLGPVAVHSKFNLSISSLVLCSFQKASSTPYPVNLTRWGSHEESMSAMGQDNLIQEITCWVNRPKAVTYNNSADIFCSSAGLLDLVLNCSVSKQKTTKTK